MGTLYIVSTPIGNLEDITVRAIRILTTVEIIACEDTRKTGLLLKHIKNLPVGKTIIFQSGKLPKTRLISFYEENERVRMPQILEHLKNGEDVALVSNSGTPTVSDPGFKLVRESVFRGIKVVPIPGPSAILAALVSSGLPTDKFLFLGFLPKKRSKRENIWKWLKANKRFAALTVVIYESPYRLLKTFFEIKTNFGDIEVVLGRELTKIHEEFKREKIGKLIEYYTKSKPKANSRFFCASEHLRGVYRFHLGGEGTCQRI